MDVDEMVGVCFLDLKGKTYTEVAEDAEFTEKSGEEKGLPQREQRCRRGNGDGLTADKNVHHREHEEHRDRRGRKKGNRR